MRSLGGEDLGKPELVLGLEALGLPRPRDQLVLSCEGLLDSVF